MGARLVMVIRLGSEDEGVGVWVGGLVGEVQSEARGILGEGDGACADEVDALDGFGQGGCAAGEGLDEELAVGGPDEGEGVDGVALAGEADVLDRVGALALLVEAAGDDVGWAFAEDDEGTRAVDGLAVLWNPGGDGFKEGALVAVDGAVALDRNVEHEVAVLADDVDQCVNDGDGRLVLVVLE